MKYRIDIPKPSAKRLEKKRRLIIHCITLDWGGGWDIEKAHDIPIGQDSFEFEFNEEISHQDETVLDGDYYHKFYVEFSNETGTRKELAEVTPYET